MFTLDVTEEIKLALVQDTFAKLYAPLVAKQQTYLSQWLAWPSFCQTEQDFQQFVQRSLHEYADKKSVTCAIFYQDNLVGNIGLHEINHDLQRTGSLKKCKGKASLPCRAKKCWNTPLTP